MSEQKIFRGLMVFYIVVLSFFVGLIIQKFTSQPRQLPSPSVSFHMEVSKNTAPEKLISQLHEWMKLDSTLSKSILSDGIPLDKPGDRPGVLALVVEPKNLLDYFIYWTVGIELGKPVTYLASSLPRLDALTKERIIAQKQGSIGGTKYYATPKKSQVIQGENGTIFINVPQNEMLKINGQTKEPVQKLEPVKPISNDKPIANTPPLSESKTGLAKTETTQEKKRIPRVLIYHTHTTETYSDDTRPRDKAYHTFSPNLGKVVTVGKEFTTALKAEGLEVYHDMTCYDNAFNDAYVNSRKGISRLLNKYDFDVVLDLHRDGNEFDTSSNHYKVEIGGKTAAQVMLVYTQGKKDYLTPSEQRKAHPNWEQNAKFCMAFATKIQEMYPGLLKRIDKRSNMIFNQDLHPHAIIIEVGYQGNTTSEVLYTAKLLGKVIAELFADQPSFFID